jgi:ABC-type nitrate/sulfonate/bicarbonate transport system substrate-binding protein
MPTIYGGLQSGIVDAAMLSPPFTFRAEDNGFREIFAFTKQDLIEPQGSILLRQAFLQADQVTVEKFIRATYKGFLYIKQNRAGTIPILGRYLQVNDDLAAKAYDQVVLPAMTQDGTLNEEMQKKAVEHVLKRLDVKEPPSLSRIFDFSIARKVTTNPQTKSWKPAP